MQRSAHDIGNLGFVRRQLPERSADGPRHSARPETKTQTRKDPAATKPAIVESVLLRDPTAKAAIVESVLQDMRALNKPMEDLSSTNTRVDQISMKLSVLDNAVKSTEKAVTALRERTRLHCQRQRRPDFGTRRCARPPAEDIGGVLLQLLR